MLPGALGAFVSQVEAQSGKKVPAEVAPILIVAAEVDAQVVPLARPSLSIEA